MQDLFGDQQQRLRLVDEDGLIDLWPHFLSAAAADDLFTQLMEQTKWGTESYQVYGKSVEAPRRVAWYGDADAVYRYSGIVHHPQTWTPLLLTIKMDVELACQNSFNSVLLNLYRDGQDSMGWHADKEPELGRNPAIASLTLGQERLFKLRHNKTKKVLDFNLTSGSLLLMHGALQHHWRHCVPKSKRPMTARINLTFRKITNN